MKHPFIPLTALLTLGACDLDRPDREPGGGIDVVARQWQCDVDDDTMTCQAAIAALPDESGAYACTEDGDVTRCPPLEAFEGLLGATEREDMLGTPWACLLTGQHQRHCMRTLTETAGPDTQPTPAPQDDSAGEAPPPSGPTDDGGSDAPSDDGDLGSCDIGVWEAHFCELATTSYQANGVDIAFPCEIFDGTAPLASTFDEFPTGGGADPDAPSCHEGEWQMRDQAWLDAVLVGCMSLSDPILVMCQQAANYAPNSGACQATGTW